MLQVGRKLGRQTRLKPITDGVDAVKRSQNGAGREVLGIDSSKAAVSEPTAVPQPELVERFEAGVIKEALRASGGSVKNCLEILKVPRKTFYDKVARFGIDLASFRDKSG